MGESSHGADCACTRCVGFTPETPREIRARGGEAHVVHGAYSSRRVGELAARYLERLKAEAPTGGELADAFAFEHLANLRARIDLAHAYLDEHGITDGDGNPRPLLRDLATWENAERRMLAELGMTAVSRAHWRLHELQGNAIEIDQARAGFVAVMQVAMETAAAVAGELLSAEERGAFARAFSDRFLPAAVERVAIESGVTTDADAAHSPSSRSSERGDR
jgi:hypothetical protein